MGLDRLLKYGDIVTPVLSSGGGLTGALGAGLTTYGGIASNKAAQKASDAKARADQAAADLARARALQPASVTVNAPASSFPLVPVLIGAGALVVLLIFMARK